MNILINIIAVLGYSLSGCWVLYLICTVFYRLFFNKKIMKLRTADGRFFRVYGSISKITSCRGNDDCYEITVEFSFNTETKDIYLAVKSAFVTIFQVEQYKKENKIPIKYEIENPSNVELDIAQFRD